jgi:hypothetical protein
MDGTVIALLVLFACLVALDLAAMRFGVNSRDGKPEYPVWSTEKVRTQRSYAPRPWLRLP